MQIQETPQTTQSLLLRRNLVTENNPKDGTQVYQSSGDDDYPDEKGLYNSVERDQERVDVHRPFTRAWWDRAIELGKLPRVIYVLVGFCLIGIWISIMLAFARSEVTAQKRNLQGDEQSRANREANQLVMIGTLKTFDPNLRILTVSWSLSYVDTDNTTLRPLGDNEDTGYPVNLYRDARVVPEKRPLSAAANQTIANWGVGPPTHRIDNATLAPVGVLGSRPWDNFDTQIDFAQAFEEDSWRQPLFGYPFDVWAGSIVFCATDREYSEAINLTNSYAFGLDGAVLSDSTLNWRITLQSNNTCNLGGELKSCELHLEFTGRRPTLVKFAAVLAVLVNWTSTIGIFLLTCEAVIMRRLHILSVGIVYLAFLCTIRLNRRQETDILGVCFTALFALPTIIIVSICTTMMAVAKIKTPKPKDA
ncbi:hypothetical protein FRC17_001657 [Serendipita sp. 399]|nr:hypothetical protein FRC17_001657 [Serendipita sp. 399]